MATEPERREILNTATLDNNEHEFCKAEFKQEWEAIQQEVEDINKEVQTLIKGNVPDVANQNCSHGVDKNINRLTVHLLKHGSNSADIPSSTDSKHQLVKEESNISGILPKQEPACGILPFYKISNQKIQNLKPTIHIALPKNGISSIKSSSFSSKQSESLVETSCKQITNIDSSEYKNVSESNSFQTVTVTCSATLKHSSNDHDGSISETLPSHTGKATLSREISSHYNTMGCVQQLNDRDKASALMGDGSTANVSHIPADFSLTDENQMLSESTLDEIFNTLGTNASSRNISVNETSSCPLTDQNETINQSEHVTNISQVGADFSLMDRSRLLSKSTMDGIFNTLNANVSSTNISVSEISVTPDKNDALKIFQNSNENEHAANMSDVVADFSLLDQTRLLSESTMQGIFNRLDADVSLENMSVSETSPLTSEVSRNGREALKTHINTNIRAGIEPTANISYSRPDFSLIDISTRKGIFNTLDADISLKNVSVSEISKIDETKQISEEFTQNPNSILSNESKANISCVVVDGLVDGSQILSESTLERIFSKRDPDVSSKNMSVDQTSPPTSLISEKCDKPMQTFKESKPKVNAGASNEDTASITHVVPDVSQISSQTSQSAMERIFNKPEAEVQPRHMLRSDIGNSYDVAMSILEQIHQNDVWERQIENKIADLVDESRILSKSSMKTNFEGKNAQISSEQLSPLDLSRIKLSSKHENNDAPSQLKSVFIGTNTDIGSFSQCALDLSKTCKSENSYYNVPVFCEPLSTKIPKSVHQHVIVHGHKSTQVPPVHSCTTAYVMSCSEEEQKGGGCLHGMANDARNIEKQEVLKSLHNMLDNKGKSKKPNVVGNLPNMTKDKINVVKSKDRGRPHNISENKSNTKQMGSQSLHKSVKNKQKTSVRGFHNIAQNRDENSILLHSAEEPGIGQLGENTNWKHIKDMSGMSINTTIIEPLRKRSSETAKLLSKKSTSSKRDDKQNCDPITQAKYKKFIDHVNPYPAASMPKAKKTKKLKFSIDVLLKKICSKKLSQKSQKTDHGDKTNSLNSAKNPQESWFVNNPFKSIFRKRSGSLAVNDNSIQPVLACVGKQNHSRVKQMGFGSDCQLLMVSELQKNSSQEQELGNADTHANSPSTFYNNHPARQEEHIFSSSNPAVYSNAVPGWPMFKWNLPAQYYSVPKAVNESPVTNDFLLSQSMIKSPPLLQSYEPAAKEKFAFEIPICSLPMTEPSCEAKLSAALSTIYKPINSHISVVPPLSKSFPTSSVQGFTVQPICEPLMEEDTLLETAIGSALVTICPSPSTLSSVFPPLCHPNPTAMLLPVRDPISPYTLLTVNEANPPPVSSSLTDLPHSSSFSSLYHLQLPPLLSPICERNPFNLSPHLEPASSAASAFLNPTTFSTISPFMHPDISSTVSHFMDQTISSSISPLHESFQSHISSLYGSPLPPLLSLICDPPFIDNSSGTPPPPHLSPMQGLNIYEDRKEQALQSSLDLKVREEISDHMNNLNPDSENHLSMMDLTANPMNCCHEASTNSKFMKQYSTSTSTTIVPTTELPPNIKIPFVQASMKGKHLKTVPLKNYMEEFVTNPKETLPMATTNFDMSLLQELNSLSGSKENESNERHFNLSKPKSLKKSGSYKIKKQRLYDDDKRLPKKSSRRKMQKKSCDGERLPIKKRYMRFTYQHDVPVTQTAAEKQPATKVLSAQTKKNNYQKKISPPTVATLMNVCQHVNKFMDIPARSISVNCRTSHKPHLIELAKMCYIQVNQTDLCIELKKTSDSRRPTATDLEWLWT